MRTPTVQQLITAMDLKGHKFFRNGALNLNLIGLRNTNEFDVEAYNDLICCAYRERAGGPLVLKAWEGTTDPGQRARSRAHFRTAVLVPGQYRGAYMVGLHKGRDALIQTGNAVSVYRANPSDEWPFSGCEIETGYFGINIHDMLNARSVVSEGCQGAHRPEDHHDMMELCRRSSHIWGDRFSYTLLDWPC